MLAYSSIAHAGYLLIGIVAGTSRGITAMLVYLMIYAFMQLGAFAVIVLLRRSDVHRRRAEGLQRPGVPQSVRGVRDAAVHAVARRHSADRRLHGQVLAVQRGDRLALLRGWRSSACSTARSRSTTTSAIVVFMYLKKETIGSEPVTSPALALVLGVAVLATLVLGVYPRLLFEVADASARTLGVAGISARSLSPPNSVLTSRSTRSRAGELFHKVGYTSCRRRALMS